MLVELCLERLAKSTPCYSEDIPELYLTYT